MRQRGVNFQPHPIICFLSQIRRSEICDQFLNSGLGLWCLTPLSTIFHLYCGCHFC